jgi:cobalamin biosynthetic protein CobC
MSAGLPKHGGDLSAASDRFGHPAGGWLDLSTGINPAGYPLDHSDLGVLSRLPERAALESLRAAFRAYASVPEGTAVAIVPGTEIAIRQLPALIPCEKVALVGPTYGSHEEAWFNTGCEIAEVRELDLVAGDASVVVITNPNNPDGRMEAIEPLVAMAYRLARSGGALVVDEAFADLEPARSLVPHLGKAPAVVLRSFGKFFGLPGLRLGFCLGAPELIEQLESRLGDWPVSSLALALGRRALEDSAWQNATRLRLTEGAHALDACLRAHDLDPVGGTNLFRLIGHAKAAQLYVHLAERGILTRIFAQRPEWIRLGIPPGSAALGRLSDALAKYDA